MLSTVMLELMRPVGDRLLSDMPSFAKPPNDVSGFTLPLQGCKHLTSARLQQDGR